jgi:branched-chain amino acid transport system substrate-binding protein
MHMRSSKIIVFVIAMLMLTLLIASCGESEPANTETVTIGLNAPLTGSGAGYGEDIKAGLDLAIKKVNDEGGLVIGDTKYMFELESSDDQMVPETALANAQRFVLQDGINIIWDPTANTIAPQLGINEKPGEEFLMMAYSSVPLYSSYPNSLSITLPPPFSVYIEPFIVNSMGNGWLKLGMIQTTGSYGDLWGKYFGEAWTGAGGTIVANAPANYYTETDFTANLTTILAANPDIIFCGGPSEPTALVIDQARGLGYTGPFLVIDQAKLDIIEEIVGMDKLEGAMGVLPVELSTDLWPAMTQFAADYKAEYGKTVTWETAICYTGAHILFEAMKAAGSVDDVMAIREAFADVSVTNGEEWPVGFSGINDDTGALLMPGTMVTVKDGEWVAGEPIEWWKE